ncbi:MAG: hypothetical protein PHN44_05740 [Candidatus Marinimicrobia bacterium]|nr:hypothetical protein [Candidatus Neomarinimicrobiota bacterium]
MPIVGLSETRRLPRLGKIRMGIKVKGMTKEGKEFERPQKTDYFVCPEIVQKVYGEKPRSLDVIIPVEDEEKFAPQFYKCYSASHGLVCKGNGDMATRSIDTLTGDMANHNTKEVEFHDMVCPGRQCPDYGPRRCKEVMNLQFLLYKIPGLGVWQIDTSSVNSIININSCIDYIRSIFGRIAMIPLQLTIEPKEVQNPENAKRQTVYVLNLRTDMTLLEMTANTRQFQNLIGMGKRISMPEPAAENDDELAVDREGEPPLSEEPDPPEMTESRLVAEAVRLGGEIETKPAGTVYRVPMNSAGVLQVEHKVKVNSESDAAFEALESAGPEKPAGNGLNVEDIIQAINDLRKRGVTEVIGAPLVERFNERYMIKDIPKGATMRDVLPLLDSSQAADLCMWLAELDAKYIDKK